MSYSELAATGALLMVRERGGRPSISLRGAEHQLRRRFRRPSRGSGHRLRNIVTIEITNRSVHGNRE